MTTNASLNIRFSVYAPNGARLGQLRDAVSWTVSRSHNGVPSLQFGYPTLGARSDLLENDCEIAVEWNDGSLWREDSDSRYFVLSTDRDENDPQQIVTYNCVGYSWMLSKATVVLSGIDINPDNNKRLFKQTSVGQIFDTLITEAKGRGNLTGLAIDFNGTTDSNGDPWLADSETISFDRGTDYLSILNNLADQGVIDWRMDGRTLRIFNPGGTLAVLRANRSRIVTTTTIDPRTYLNAATSTTVDYSGGGAWTGEDAVRISDDVLALGHDGYPRYWNTLNYEYLSGVWDGQPSRQLACYRQLGQNPDDLVTRAFGSYIAEVTGKVRYVVVIPDASDTNVMYTAVQLLQILPNGLIMQAGTSGADWFTQASSGFHAAITELIRCSLPVIVIDQFTDVVKTSSGTQVFGIVQNGNALLKPAHGAVDQQFTTQGIGPAVTDDADTFPFDYDGNRPDWINGKRWLQSIDARRRRSLWMRVLVHSSRMASTALQISTATAIANGITSALPVGMDKAAPKASIDPDVDRSAIGPVVIRYDRDLEAPVTRSIENYAAVAYAYGDSFAKVVVENDAADLPWGKWETVIGQGGLDDPTTMEPLALQALDQGALAKVSLTRRIALRDCQWLPYRDYDPGDIVLAQTATNDLRPYQIKQMALDNNTGGNGSLSVNLVMEDTFESREERITRAVLSANGTVGGSARVGGAGVKPQPNSADNRVPLAPTNLVVTGDSMLANDGFDYPVLHISWDPVTLATNGAVAAIASYSIYLAIGADVAREIARVAGTETSVDFSLNPLPAGTTGVVSVLAVGSNGREGDRVTSAPLALDIDTSPPPTPTTPTVTSSLGNLIVSWDKTLDNTIPGDFDHCNVHMGTTPGFTVNNATLIGEVTLNHPSLLVGGQPYDAMRYFRLTSVDRRGNESTPSASAGSSVQQVGTADLKNGAVGPNQISSVTTDKLSGTINLDTTPIESVAGDNRMFVNGDGISVLSASDDVLMTLDTTTGLLTGAGTMSTSATSYPRVTITDSLTVGVFGDTSPRSAVVFEKNDTERGAVYAFQNNESMSVCVTPSLGSFTAVSAMDGGAGGPAVQLSAGDATTAGQGWVGVDQSSATMRAYTPTGDAGTLATVTPSRFAVRDSQAGRELFAIDRTTGNAYITGRTFIRSLGGAETDITVTRSGSTLTIDNQGTTSVQIGTGSGRLQYSSGDRIVWGPDGGYVYKNLYLRSAGGSEADVYLTRGAGNTWLTLQSGRVYTPGVYATTTTGSANVRVGSDGLIARTSSLSADKIDQQDVTADYRILELQPKTWIDRAMSEQYEDYADRTAGFVAEDVQALSERCDGAFAPLAITNPETGALESVAYDRIESYHLPVTADIHRRLTDVEAERDELRALVAQLTDRLAAVEARMEYAKGD